LRIPFRDRDRQAEEHARDLAGRGGKSDRKATLKTLGLQIGKNQIRVKYTPDTGFNSSSATIVENVQQRR
jgi:hypothetical protein